MPDLNCHFVSRFLTKPWEFGERQLYFYDVRTREFKHKSSRKLFAVQGLNTEETEKRLNRLIETPLGSVIGDLTKSSKPEGYSIEDWPVYRALVLLFPFQVARVSPNPAPGFDLAGLCNWSEDKLNELANAYRQRYKFVTIRSHPGSPFYYPSKGYFTIPLAFASSLEPTAIAIPLTEHWAVASVPAEIDDQQLTDLLTYAGGGLASNASTGTNSDQVAIHPSVMMPENEDRIRQHIDEMQELNLRRVQEEPQFNRDTVALYAEAGISPEETLRRPAELGRQVRDAFPGAAEQVVAAQSPQGNWSNINEPLVRRPRR
jgi:hypothetical protein